MYSFIKSLWWQICLYRPVEAVGNPHVSTQTCFQWRALALGTERVCSCISSLFPESFAALFHPVLAQPGPMPCFEFSLWSNPSRHSLALFPEWREERHKPQAESHLFPRLETRTWFLK
jgi:hypothetical protein